MGEFLGFLLMLVLIAVIFLSLRSWALLHEKERVLKLKRAREAAERIPEAARPLAEIFAKALFERFDCGPCPRCAELEMLIHRMSPNGRSFEVSCKDCLSNFRWKAVHPDTAEVSNAYRSLLKAIAGSPYRHAVVVPPNRLSVAVGREPIPQGLRQVVWRRDGGRCVQCGAESNLHFDHIIPVARGGATTIENLQILCAQCNLSKGARI